MSRIYTDVYSEPGPSTQGPAPASPSGRTGRYSSGIHAVVESGPPPGTKVAHASNTPSTSTSRSRTPPSGTVNNGTPQFPGDDDDCDCCTSTNFWLAVMIPIITAMYCFVAYVSFMLLKYRFDELMMSLLLYAIEPCMFAGLSFMGWACPVMVGFVVFERVVFSVVENLFNFFRKKISSVSRRLRAWKTGGAQQEPAQPIPAQRELERRQWKGKRDRFEELNESLLAYLGGLLVILVVGIYKLVLWLPRSLAEAAPRWKDTAPAPWKYILRIWYSWRDPGAGPQPAANHGDGDIPLDDLGRAEEGQPEKRRAGGEHEE